MVRLYWTCSTKDDPLELGLKVKQTSLRPTQNLGPVGALRCGNQALTDTHKGLRLIKTMEQQIIIHSSTWFRLWPIDSPATTNPRVITETFLWKELALKNHHESYSSAILLNFSLFFHITQSICGLLHLAFISFLVPRNRIGVMFVLPAVKLKDQLISHYHLISGF